MRTQSWQALSHANWISDRQSEKNVDWNSIQRLSKTTSKYIENDYLFTLIQIKQITKFLRKIKFRTNRTINQIFMILFVEKTTKNVFENQYSWSNIWKICYENFTLKIRKRKQCQQIHKSTTRSTLNKCNFFDEQINEKTIQSLILCYLRSRIYDVWKIKLC